MTGLQKQHALINFGQGIDTKTDPKLVVQGQLTSLVNGVFKKRGRIDKRNGNQVLSPNVIDGNVLSNASALGIFNNELLQYNKQVVYSYSENANAWVDKGPCVSASMETSQILKGTSSQTQVDWAAVNGIGLYAYEDSRGGVRATVVDIASGTLMLNDMSINTSAQSPRCVAFNDRLYLFYYVSGNLMGMSINPLVPNQFTSPVTIVTNVNSTYPTFDVVPYSNARIAFAYNTSTSNTTIFGFLDGNLNSLNSTLPNLTFNESSQDSLTIVLGPTNTIFLAYCYSGIGARCVILNNGGTVLLSPFAIDATTGSVFANITGFADRDNSGVTFFYEVSGTPGSHINKVKVSTAGSVSGQGVFLRGVGLYSRAFSFYFDTESVDHAYVCITHASTLQSTYYITRDDGLIVAKMQYSTGGGLTTRPLLANVFAINAAGTQFSFPILNKFQLVSENNNLFSLQGVSQTTIDFDAQEQFNAASLGNNLHIAGGILNTYDGQSVVEHGFLLYPEGITASQSGSAGVNTGVYNYVALYEWTDNYGQIHRSAPSVPTQYQVTSGPAAVTVDVPTLRLTRKREAWGRTEVSVVTYRTTGESGAPGAIYYRASSISAPVYNDATIDSVGIEDFLTDSALVSNEILYDTGGELDNIPAPSSKYINVFKNRIILAGLEDPNTVWFSKIYAFGEGIGFNDSLIINLPPQGNDITAIGVLDDKMVIFKQDRLYIVYGDGPDNTGGGTPFSTPQIVSNDVGCPFNSSLVRAPNGVMFMSLKGIYLLDSSLGVTYIGAQVEDFNSYTITAAVLKHDINQVRFTTNQNTTLVYDYYFQTWSTFGNYSVQDASIWNETYVFIDGNGDLLYEDETSFKDNGAGIQLALTTGWITFDSIIGYQRIYKLSFIGEFKSDHILRVRVAYDFSNAFTSTYYFNTLTGLGVETYGSTSPYGADTTYGGGSSAYRFTATLDVQKCQAIRFEIMDLTTSASSGTGEALNISGLGLQIGIKGQVGKFRSQQQIGSS